MIRINLLPRVPRRRLPSRRLLEFGLPLLTLAAVIVLGISLGVQNAGLEREIATVDTEISQLRETEQRVIMLDRQIKEMREKESVITDLLKQQLPAASVLNEIRLLIPRQVWITALSVPEPSSLNLEGMATGYNVVAQLMDNLSAGQLFSEVDLSVVQLEKVGPTDVVRFQVTARLARPQAAGGGRP